MSEPNVAERKQILSEGSVNCQLVQGAARIARE